MRQYVLQALLCLVSSVIGSALTIAVLRPAAPPVEEEAAAEDEAFLVAKQIVLTDESGAARVRLSGDAAAQGSDGGLVVFYDQRGVPRLRAGLDSGGGPYLTLQNSELPNPDHKRISLAVNDDTARVDVGHGELTEIVLLSSPQSVPPSSVIRVQGRNGSESSLYTDPYGHATIEVKDLTTASLFRVPEWKPLLPR